MSLLGLPLSKGMLIGVGVLLLIVATESGVIVRQAKTIGKLEEQKGGLEHQVAQGKLTLGACTKTRDALRSSLEVCIKEVRVAQDENAFARQQVDQLAEHIRQTSEAVTRERAALFSATPSCHELAVLDISSVCPGIARSLRERAARMSAAREGTNANPGAP